MGYAGHWDRKQWTRAQEQTRKPLGCRAHTRQRNTNPHQPPHLAGAWIDFATATKNPLSMDTVWCTMSWLISF